MLKLSEKNIDLCLQKREKYNKVQSVLWPRRIQLTHRTLYHLVVLLNVLIAVAKDMKK